MEITEQYAALQDKIAGIGSMKFYKPVKGDLVDECFAQYLNSAQIDVPVRRVKPNVYQFGQR